MKLSLNIEISLYMLCKLKFTKGLMVERNQISPKVLLNLSKSHSHRLKFKNTLQQGLKVLLKKSKKSSAHLQNTKTKLAKYKQSLLKSAFNDTLTATASLQDFEKAETIHIAASLRANEVDVVKHKKQILVILSVAKYPKIKTQMQQILWILRFLRKLRMTKIEIFHLRLNITKWGMTVLSTTANHAS